jgi:phosphoglycolate phosphatase
MAPHCGSFMVPNNDFEIIHGDIPRGRFRSVLFDFDGTLSLIREGWPQVMIPMMVEILRETGTKEIEAQLTAAVEDFVMRLNGRQTIYQMIQLADEVRARGGQPLEPLAYKHQYHDLLMKRIQRRLHDLETGQARPEDWTVPGSHEFLQSLKDRSLNLFLASGTDLKYVRHEAELLGLTRFFENQIYGALDDYKNFSKKMVIERIIGDHDLQGDQLLGFGDGFVEIEEIKRVGGVAVAVASDEVNRQGINQWKRQRLIQAGADLVIPDFRRHEELVHYLFDA